MKRICAVLAVLGTVACGEAGPPTAIPEGVWGSRQAILRLGPTEGRIEFGCADGAFPAPVPLDAQGRFSVSGTHTQGTSVTPPTPPSPRPAVYRGRVDGSRMEVSVEVDGNAPFGPFTLVLGDSRPIVKCAAARRTPPVAG